MHSGFEAPPRFLTIPKDYRTEVDKDGFIHIYAPKGAEIPEELKRIVEEEK